MDECHVTSEAGSRCGGCVGVRWFSWPPDRSVRSRSTLRHCGQVLKYRPRKNTKNGTLGFNK